MFPYYALQPYAYCAIWVRRSNFCHQGSPRVSPRESTQRWKVELWARNVREFCLNAEFHATFRDLLHAVKLRHGTDGFISAPKEGALRIFFALKIRRLRPGLNPRTWVPKASTLPLDHRSRCAYSWFYCRNITRCTVPWTLNFPIRCFTYEWFCYNQCCWESWELVSSYVTRLERSVV
jgi:hypothetical protein